MNLHLSGLENPGGEVSFEWASRADAYSPFDFIVRHAGGAQGDTRFLLDVKATTGAFARDFHISMAEVLEADGSGVPYFIWRFYGTGPDGASMRKSGDIREFARGLIGAHDEAMPMTTAPLSARSPRSAWAATRTPGTWPRWTTAATARSCLISGMRRT